MKVNHFVFAMLVLAFLSTALVSSVRAQDAEKSEVHDLIKQLSSRDEQTVLRAAQALAKMGSKVAPLLSEKLKVERGCQFQFVASGVLYRIDRRKDTANSVLTDVALGRCQGSSENDLMARRRSAFILVARSEGIPVVAEMLTNKDVFVRRSAAFAFDELTERIEVDRPDKIEASPEIIAATKAALPRLVRALSDKDEVVRCMSDEAVQLLRGSSHPELKLEANRLMEGVKARCDK